MQDAIINGSGNSRFLKSINEFLTLYPDYESFALALIEGTLPIDLNGINPAGWAQQGTPLNKANLLSDTTETAIWGDTADRTVDEALAQIGAVAKSAQSTANTSNAKEYHAKIVSFAGTGTTGTFYINLPFTPTAIADMSMSSSYFGQAFCYQGKTVSGYGARATLNGKRIQLQITSTDSGWATETYRFLAVS